MITKRLTGICIFILCFCSMKTFAQEDAKIMTQDLGKGKYSFSVVGLPEKPAVHPDYKQKGEDEIARWTFLYQFGDGNFHYSEEDGGNPYPVHQYFEDGPHQVKVYILPLYSDDLDLVLEKELQVKNTGAPSTNDPTSRDSDKLIQIHGNSNNFAAAGYRFRFAAECRASRASKHGYLILAFNKKSEFKKLMRIPFKLDAQEGFGANFENIELNKISDTKLRTKAIDLKRSFYDVKILRVTNIEKSAKPLIYFFTLKATQASSDPKGNVDTGSQHEDTLNLKLRTFFFEDNSRDLDADRYSDAYDMSMQKAVDPNALRAIPEGQWYIKNKENATFRVDFENTGKGLAKTVMFQIPWPVGQLDTDLNILKISRGPKEWKQCPANFDLDVSTEPCYQVYLDTESGTPLMTVRLNNINLAGKQNVNIAKKKFAHGYVEFKVTPLKAKNVHLSHATIYFIGNNTTEVKTKGKGANIKWRQNQFSLGLGTTMDMSNNSLGLSAELAYRWRIKMGRGLGFKVGVDFSPLSYSEVRADSAFEGGPGSGILIDELRIKDNIDVQMAGLSLTANYGLNRWISVIAGAGVLIPISGSMGASYEVQYIYEGTDPRIGGFERESSWGSTKLVGDTPVELIEPLKEAPAFFGYKGIIGLEFLARNSITVGISYEKVFLPDFYTFELGACEIRCEPPKKLAPFSLPADRLRIHINFPLNISPRY